MVNKALSVAVRSIFHEIQRTQFAVQEEYAREVERDRYLFAGLVIVVTGGALLYGARLRRKIRAAETSWLIAGDEFLIIAA
jgi:hypothetical protein